MGTIVQLTWCDGQRTKTKTLKRNVFRLFERDQDIEHLMPSWKSKEVVVGNSKLGINKVHFTQELLIVIFCNSNFSYNSITYLVINILSYLIENVENARQQLE